MMASHPSAPNSRFIMLVSLASPVRGCPPSATPGVQHRSRTRTVFGHLSPAASVTGHQGRFDRRQATSFRHVMAALPAEAPGYTEERLSFVNPKGERLVGVLVDTGSQDVVILCHGYVANYTMCQFPQLAAGLAESGVSSFRFDHAMAIKSESERKGPFKMGNHDDEVADIQAAVQFMRGRGKNVTCVLGHSKGGINILLYGSRHAGDVPRLVNLSGRFCVRDGVLQRFGSDIFDRLAANPEGIPRREPFGLEWTMTEEDFRGRADLDMEGAARSIPASVEVLVLHGTGDATIPFQESEQCAALISNARLQLIEGADHNFTKPEHAQQMVEAVVAFVKS